jgi:DNA-directed RNA polymerase subunit omega
MKKNVTYDELLAKEPNKYKLAMTLGKRYGQIIAGEAPLVKVRKKDTVAEIVSKELLEGKIELERVETEG